LLRRPQLVFAIIPFTMSGYAAIFSASFICFLDRPRRSCFVGRPIDTDRTRTLRVRSVLTSGFSAALICPIRVTMTRDQLQPYPFRLKLFLA